MAMPQTIRWTPADLDRLPDDGNRYEVVDGALFVTPPPSEVHEAIASWVSARLTVFVGTHRVGVVHRPRAVILSRDSIVEPDLMVRQPQDPDKIAWVEAPLPILVVEVASDSTWRRDRVNKRTFYADAEIPEYWIVDGDDRTIRIIRLGHEDVVARDSFQWHPANVAVPLVISVADVFGPATKRSRES